MIKPALFVAACLLLEGTAMAAPPLCYKIVSSGSAFTGSTAAINDGAIPARGSAYNAADKVHDFGPGVVFSLTFSEPVKIASILATVDNNDTYTFRFYDFSKGGNGYNQKYVTTIAPGDGTVPAVPGGVETFAPFPAGDGTVLKALNFPPVTATTVNVQASGGDGRFSIGEIELFAPYSGLGNRPKTGRCGRQPA